MDINLPPFAITGIGSLPLVDLDDALELIEVSAPLIPFVPQLAAADSRQMMIPQLLAGIAAPIIGAMDGGPYRINAEQARALVEAISAAGSHGQALDGERYSGIFRLESDLKNGKFAQAAMVKTQIVGPLTTAAAFFCDEVNLGTDYSILDELAALIAKTAEAEVALLRGSTDLPVALWLDEPILEQFVARGDPYLHRAGLDLLATMVANIRAAGAVVGIHCCSFPPLSTFMSIKPDIISIDAWSGLEKLFDGKAERELIDSETILALGIVPTGPELDKVTADELEQKLEHSLFSHYDRNQLQSRIILTPSCGLALNTPEQAQKAFSLLGQLRRNLLD